jgi:hypothetical protein
VLQDVALFEETQDILTLRNILALGNTDVAAGKVKSGRGGRARLLGDTVPVLQRLHQAVPGVRMALAEAFGHRT